MMQSESSILQKDLNRINDVISFVKDINNSETPDMVAFLLRFRKINETVELCLAKQIKSNIVIIEGNIEENLNRITNSLKM